MSLHETPDWHSCAFTFINTNILSHHDSFEISLLSQIPCRHLFWEAWCVTFGQCSLGSNLFSTRGLGPPLASFEAARHFVNITDLQDYRRGAYWSKKRCTAQNWNWYQIHSRIPIDACWGKLHFACISLINVSSAHTNMTTSHFSGHSDDKQRR